MSFASDAFKLSFQISPIILTGGIASEIPGGMLPALAVTDAISFVTGIWDEVLGDKDRIHEIRIAFAHGIEAAHGIGGGV